MVWAEAAAAKNKVDTRVNLITRMYAVSTDEAFLGTYNGHGVNPVIY